MVRALSSISLQGGNLKIMHTYIVDMFVFGMSEGFASESGLHRILVVLTTERKMPTVRQSDGNVVVQEKRPQRHDPHRSKPRNKNCGVLQKVKAQAALYMGVLESTSSVCQVQSPRRGRDEVP
jgi:hypothetical protein